MAKGKKQEDPSKVAQRKAERVAFVQANPNLAPEVARQRFYVQTRASELEAAGKDVDRAALRQKFQSGGVTREGFYTPGDVNRFKDSSNSDSLADSKITNVIPPVSPVAPSATNVPTPVKPTTSSVKTPPTSYQAPQTTTSLGQVVTPPTSYQAPRKGTPARGGEPGRGVKPPALVRPEGTPVPGGEPRPPVWESGKPVIGDVTSGGRVTSNGIVYKQPGVNEGREFTAAVNRVFPQAPANPKALRQQQQARWQRVDAPRIQAEMNRNNPLRAAQQAKIDAGFVEAPYDWTNLYKVTAGSLTLAAEIAGTRFGGPVGGALATGAAFNVTERLGNLLESKGALGGTPGDPGRFEGKTDFKSAATVAGASLAGYGIGAGLQKVVPKIASALPGVKTSISDWAQSAVARESMTPGQITAQRVQKVAAKGTKGAEAIPLPKDLPYSGVNYGVVTGTSSMPSVQSETAAAVVGKMRRETLAIGPIGDPGATMPRSQSPVKAKTAAAPFPESKTLDSGLLIPGVPKRSPVLQDALDKVLGKEAAQPPVSLGDSKAATAKAMADDGVEELTPRQIAARKGVATKQAKKDAALKLQQQNVEPKAPEVVPAAKQEPVPNVTPEPAAPKLVQRANETDAQYAKRLQAETFKNSGAVTKVQAGFELPRLTGRDKTIAGVEAGMSRSNRLSFIDDMSEEVRPKFGVVQGESAERLAMMRNHPAFTSKLPEAPANLSEVKAPRMRDRFADINEAGEFDLMSPQGFPQSEPGESIMQFNQRVARFQEARGKAVPSQEGNYPASGAAPEAPKSLTGNVEPKRPKVNKFGQRLNAKAKINPETGEFQNVKIDPSTGEEVFVMPRVKGQQKTNAEKQSAKRLNQKGVVEVKQVPEAEKGTFTVAGQTIEGTKVVLPRGVSGTGKFVGENIPDDSSLLRMTTEERVAYAAANPKMDVEGWANRTLSPDEQQLFKNLREAQGQRASRRVAEPVKGKRAMKPGAELASYEQRYTEILTNQGEINKVSFMRSKQQVALEREIENAFGTDAMVTLRNRFATAADSIPTSGVDVSPAPASFSEVLPSQLRQELPVKPGANLREQAAQLFNKQGLLKGKTGPGRARLWQQVKESAWFRELVAKEPTFANYLVTQNADLAAGYRAISLSEGIGGPRTPRMGGQEKYAGKLTEEQAAKQIANEELRSANIAANTGALQEARDARRATSQLFPGEEDAFGQINTARIARETGVSLTPEQQSVLKEFGVLDPSGAMQMKYAEAAAGFKELTQPIPRGARVSSELSNEVTVAKKQAFYDQFGEAPKGGAANSKGWVKEQWLQKKDEYMGSLMDQPSTSPFFPEDPFSTRIDPNLVDPNMPVRPEALEQAAAWRKKQDDVARKAAEDAQKQQVFKAKMEEDRAAGLLKEPNIDDFLNPRPARNVPPPTLEQMKQRFLIEEQTRRESLARAAAKAKAASFEVKAVDPFADLGTYNPATGTYVTDFRLPSGTTTRIEARLGIGPPSPKQRFFVEERTFTRLNPNESPKMTAAEAESLMAEFKETEIANQREILKDWMSGD